MPKCFTDKVAHQLYYCHWTANVTLGVYCSRPNGDRFWADR